MDLNMLCEALQQTGLFPDCDGTINAILFLIISAVFIAVVVGSKKYSYLFKSIERFF